MQSSLTSASRLSTGIDLLPRRIWPSHPDELQLENSIEIQQFLMVIRSDCNTRDRFSLIDDNSEFEQGSIFLAQFLQGNDLLGSVLV